MKYCTQILGDHQLSKGKPCQYFKNPETGQIMQFDLYFKLQWERVSKEHQQDLSFNKLMNYSTEHISLYYEQPLQRNLNILHGYVVDNSTALKSDKNERNTNLDYDQTGNNGRNGDLRNRQNFSSNRNQQEYREDFENYLRFVSNQNSHAQVRGQSTQDYWNFQNGGIFRNNERPAGSINRNNYQQSYALIDNSINKYRITRNQLKGLYQSSMYQTFKAIENLIEIDRKKLQQIVKKINQNTEFLDEQVQEFRRYCHRLSQNESNTYSLKFIYKCMNFRRGSQNQRKMRSIWNQFFRWFIKERYTIILKRSNKKHKELFQYAKAILRYFPNLKTQEQHQVLQFESL